MIDDEVALIDLLGRLQDTGGYNVIADVVKRASQDTRLFDVVLEQAAKDHQLFAEAAAALNLVIYKNAVDELKKLIETDGAREQRFQDLLALHPWMSSSTSLFGNICHNTTEVADVVERRNRYGVLNRVAFGPPCPALGVILPR